MHEVEPISCCGRAVRIRSGLRPPTGKLNHLRVLKQRKASRNSRLGAAVGVEPSGIDPVVHAAYARS